MSLPPPSTTPPGWYPDPQRPGGWRWWDGTAWREQTSAPRPGPPPALLIEGERSVARWLRTALLVEAAAYVIQLIALGSQIRLLVDIIGDDDDFERQVPSWFAVAQVVGFIGLGVLVLRVIWLSRAADAGKRLGRPARHEPGLAAAGWIIPVVNLWFPFQDVRALLGRDHPDRERVAWWWALHLIGQFGVIAVVAAAFAPVAVQVVAVAVCALAYAAAALLERDLVAAVLAGHESAAGIPAR